MNNNDIKIKNNIINSDNNEININNNDINTDNINTDNNIINTDKNENNNNMDIEYQHEPNDDLNYNQDIINNNDDNNNIAIQNQENVTTQKVKVDHIYYIETYYDTKFNTTYIISCCSEYVKSFNYNLNTLYHLYQENTSENKIHGNVIIDDNNLINIVRLIETCNDGYVRIWDFHLGDLLNKIQICDEGIKSICLWDEDHIFVGCDDASIKMVDINTNEILHVLYGHKEKVCCLKKVEHEKFGKCIVSKGWGSDAIKLWKKK